MKKIGVVSSLLKWRASPALIDEDFRGCAVHGLHVEGATAGLDSEIDNQVPCTYY